MFLGAIILPERRLVVYKNRVLSHQHMARLSKPLWLALRLPAYAGFPGIGNLHRDHFQSLENAGADTDRPVPKEAGVG